MWGIGDLIWMYTFILKLKRTSLTEAFVFVCLFIRHELSQNYTEIFGQTVVLVENSFINTWQDTVQKCTTR